MNILIATQQVRLFLIAPSFSQTLVNRCRWFDVPVSLFTYSCLKLDGASDVVADPGASFVLSVGPSQFVRFEVEGTRG